MFIDKLQGSVTTYLRCGGGFNNQIKKGLLMNLSVKNNKIGEYLAKIPARTWLSRALSSFFSSVMAKRTQCTRQPPSCLKKFTDRLSNKPLLIWLLTAPPHLKYVATLSCN